MLLAYCTNHITYYHTGGSTNPRPLKSTFVVPFSAFLVGHFVAVPAVSVLERVYSSIIEIGLVKPHFNTEWMTTWNKLPCTYRNLGRLYKN